MADLTEQQLLSQDPEILGLQRQRQLANLLTGQAFNQPQGQMISGYYVKPSGLQQALPMINAAIGGLTNANLDTKQQELAAALRQKQVTQLEQYGQLEQKDKAAALRFALSSDNPILRDIAKEELKGIKLEEGAIYQKPSLSGAMTELKGNPKYRAPLHYDLGSYISVRDPNDPTKEVQRLPKNLGPGEAARLAYEGIPVGGNGQLQGQPQGQPMVGGQGGGQSGGQFAPKTTPQYEYNPILSPKQNQEAAGKFYTTQQTNMTNAKDSFDLMKSASDILKSNAPSSGRGENIITGAREFFGGGGKTSEADASLNMLSGALTMKQPRFEGPQGVLDVTLYQKLAGDLGNANIPVPSRLATMKQMVDLQKKYYPNADWDSIKTEIDSASKVSLGAAPQYATNPQTGERRMSTDGGKNWKPAR